MGCSSSTPVQEGDTPGPASTVVDDGGLRVSISIIGVRGAPVSSRVYARTAVLNVPHRRTPLSAVAADGAASFTPESSRFDFVVKGAAMLAAGARVAILKHSSLHDTLLGSVDVALPLPSRGVSAFAGGGTLTVPTPQWLPVSGAEGCEVGVRVIVSPLDGTASGGGYATRTGLLVAQLEGIENLILSPHVAHAIAKAVASSRNAEVRAAAAVLVGKANSFREHASAFAAVLTSATGAGVASPPPDGGPGYRLRVVLTYGLREFAVTAALPAGELPAKLQLSHAQCRVWVSQGEESFVARATVYAEVPTSASASGESATGFLVPIARAWLPIAPCQDGRGHAYRVQLLPVRHAKSGGDAGSSHGSLLQERDLAALKLLGASQGTGLVAPSPSPDGAASPKTPALVMHEALLPQGVAHDDGSGFHGTASPALTALPSGGLHVFGLTVEDGDEVSDVPAGGPSADALGVLMLSCVLLPKAAVEDTIVRRVFKTLDKDGSGTLSYTEGLALFAALGCQMNEGELAAAFRTIDTDGSGTLSMGEVVKCLASSHMPMAYSTLSFLANGPSATRSVLNDLTAVTTLAGSAPPSNARGAGRLVVRDGGRLVVDELGLVCLDRATGVLVAEFIPSYVKTALVLMYHSTLGRTLTSTPAVRLALARLSASEGKEMDSTHSRRHVDTFVRTFNIDLSELDRPLDEFTTFNAFFSRALRPGARPIAAPDDACVAVSPADCRIMAFASHAEAASVWIKGASYSLERLLGGAEGGALSRTLEGGAVVVCRLAPQDYHRWHWPVAGIAGSRTPLPGALFTVSPIAIREPKPDVFTENKREVCVVKSPEFGVVAVVAVGATAVGSIVITTPDNARVSKGDEHGQFKFGGSTVILCFEPGAITLDADLVSNSQRPLETIVRMGERIGVAARSSRG